MLEGLEIDSYEPYMIGLKINQNIQINSIEKIIEILPEMGFEIAPQSPNMQGPGISLKIGPSAEIIGIKEGVELKINKNTHSINIEGESPENVQKIFNEMPEIFDKIKYDINETIIFYEIITNVIVKTERNPREIINSSCSINLNPLSDLNTHVSAIKINSVDEENSKLMGLIIEPKAGNPHKMYFVNLIYRCPTIDELNQFHQELPDKIIELLASLEE